MDCVCEQGMGVGARLTGLSVKICNAAGFLMLNSFLCVSRMVRQPNDIQSTSMGSIGVNMGQHPRGMLSTPCIVHDPRN
jgi:hypothetical protein